MLQFIIIPPTTWLINIEMAMFRRGPPCSLHIAIANSQGLRSSPISGALSSGHRGSWAARSGRPRGFLVVGTVISSGAPGGAVGRWKAAVSPPREALVVLRQHAVERQEICCRP